LVALLKKLLVAARQARLKTRRLLQTLLRNAI
jgi:hypothetical protein